MAKKIQTTGLVLSVNTLKNTTLGNPRFYVVIDTDNGEVLRGNTASNNMFCYCMPNEGDKVSVVWHETKKQNVIFDDIETIESGTIE